MLNESNQAERVARFLHPGLAPLARLDEDGLLAPPHLYASLFTTSSGQRVMTVTGPGQPSDPSYQYDFTQELLEAFSKAKIPEVLVLAGLSSPPEKNQAFVVASSSAHRVNMEEKGVDVRRDQPSGGAIGMSALMASMGPLFNIHSACAMATTVGASGDVHASLRLLESINEGWSLNLILPEDVTSGVIQKLLEIAPKNTADHVRELTEEPDAFYI
jgi:proteasome assembly chaperone (PAC2) family protein